MRTMKHYSLLAVLAAFTLFLAGCAPAQTVVPENAVSMPEQTLPLPEAEGNTEAAAAMQTEPAPDPEPEYTDPLQPLADRMTTEQKVGQLFLISCPSGDAQWFIRTYKPGGLLLFGKDFDGQTPDSIRRTLAACNASSALPLLFAVDEEGGTVTRVSRVSAFRESRFLSPREYFAQGGMEAVLAAEEEKALLLTGLGINVNLGPVCDIATSPGDFMYRRSLGQSPEITGEFIAQTVTVMRDCHLGSVLKHFPGYGANTDTHTGVARDGRSLQSLEEYDLVPFRAGIDAGCGAIMVSHTIIDAFDPVYPATLSPEVHRYIREDLGFGGVIITDDLAMGAITQLYGAEEAAVMAVLAGNDLLCTTSYASQYPAVLEAVLDGRISMEILEAAVLRVLHWKQQLGLIP